MKMACEIYRAKGFDASFANAKLGELALACDRILGDNLTRICHAELVSASLKRDPETSSG